MSSTTTHSSATLDEIGLKHGTDKSSSFHNYLEFYENFFAPLRHEKLKILEIGVLGGASLRTWEEYFPYADIIGLDIVPDSMRFAGGRVAIELADQSNIELLTQAALKYGPFDIIIEDGSHMWEHQITSLRTLFPHVKDNGLFIVEDLQTNYGDYIGGYKGIASISCVEYLKLWLDLRVGDDAIKIEDTEDAFLRTYGRAIAFMTFYRRACLIKKQVHPQPSRHYPGTALFDPSPAHTTAPLTLTAHLGYKGDVAGPAGFVNLDADKFAYQALALNSPYVEYRVRLADLSWGPWISASGLAGSTGKGESLTGLSLRLTKEGEMAYRLRGMARFGGGEMADVIDGQDCVSSAGQPLYGLQVELVRKG